MVASPETLSETCEGGSQSSSTTHGYAYGGYIDVPGGSPYPHKTLIEKFAFASGNQQANHGDISNAGTVNDKGAQNTTHGFSVGGTNFSGTLFTDINSYAFASNVTATKVSDLAFTSSGDSAGSQVPTTH